MPAPEVTVDIDESQDQESVDALLAATFAPRVEQSQWQAESLPLERPTFPVTDLDSERAS